MTEPVPVKPELALELRLLYLERLLAPENGVDAPLTRRLEALEQDIERVLDENSDQRETLRAFLTNCLSLRICTASVSAVLTAPVLL